MEESIKKIKLQQIEAQKRFVEIDKATIEELIAQGEDEEVINFEREALKADEEQLTKMIKELEEN